MKTYLLRSSGPLVAILTALLFHSPPAIAASCDLPMFAGARLFAAPAGVQGIVTADFNHDGFTDLAVLVPSGSASGISILLGSGDGTFQPACSDGNLAFSSG